MNAFENVKDYFSNSKGEMATIVSRYINMCFNNLKVEIYNDVVILSGIDEYFQPCKIAFFKEQIGNIVIDEFYCTITVDGMDIIVEIE